jgi:hypothetical protein
MSTLSYTARLVHSSPSLAAQRLPTLTPPEEPPRRRLVVRIRRPGTQTEGVGIIPDMNVPAPATETAASNDFFGPQAGPATIHSFTAAAMSPGLAEPSTVVHPSFTGRTIAACRGATPFFSEAGEPPSASSTTGTQEATATAPSQFGRVGTVDRRPGIRRGSWSPAALGLSSSGNWRPASSRRPTQAGAQGATGRHTKRRKRGRQRSTGGTRIYIHGTSTGQRWRCALQGISGRRFQGGGFGLGAPSPPFYTRIVRGGPN